MDWHKNGHTDCMQPLLMDTMDYTYILPDISKVYLSALSVQYHPLT